MHSAVLTGRKTGAENSGVSAVTDWVIFLKGARTNSRFAREVRVTETTVRQLIRHDTLKIFSSETLGRLIEWERRTMPDALDCQSVDLTRGERIVLAYIRSLARLPRRQYVVARSRLSVTGEDLVADLGLENE